jgi:endonuclease YncB( thermonuclease family)
MLHVYPRELVMRRMPAVAFALCSFASPSSLALAQPAAAVTGTASLVDGDTLDINNSRFRLFGIDAPEMAQQCKDHDDLIYHCGSKARLALKNFIAGLLVTCSPVVGEKKTYASTVARCEVDGKDLAEWLVEQGHALDWPLYSNGIYDQAQQKARGAGRGLWDGKFVLPWDFRTCLHQRGGKAAQCSVVAPTSGK